MIRIINVLLENQIKNIVLNKISKYHPQFKEEKEEYNTLFNCLPPLLQETATKYAIDINTDVLLHKYIDAMVKFEAEGDISIEIVENIINKAYKFNFIMHSIVNEIIRYKVLNKLIYKVICDEKLSYLPDEVINKLKKAASSYNEARIEDLNKGLKLLSMDDEDYSFIEYIGMINGIVDEVKFDHLNHKRFREMYEEDKLDYYLDYIVFYGIKVAKG